MLKIKTHGDILQFEESLTPILWKKVKSRMEVIVIDDRDNEDKAEIEEENRKRKEADITRLGFDPENKQELEEQYSQGMMHNHIQFEIEPLIFSQDSKAPTAVPYLRVGISAFESEEHELEHFLVEKTRK